MPSTHFAPVTIVGAGFSGTMMAAQLARRQIDSLLVESRRYGLGAAYSTEEPRHLMNVAAEKASAWPDKPDHFAEEWAEYGGRKEEFAPRLVYGRYLRGILEETVETEHTKVIPGAAVSAERQEDGWLLRLRDGTVLRSVHLVLATGNGAPAAPPWSSMLHRGFVSDPWSNEAQQAIARVAAHDGDVLIVGTGLTMIDIVLSLDAAGHRGAILAVSRHGMLPRAHGPGAAAVALELPPSGRLADVWNHIRRAAAVVGWRAAVDSLRPHSQSLWREFSLEEKRRFLRHGRCWWDVHRHRIAPAVAAQLDELLESGRLNLAAAGIVDASDEGHRVLVRMSPRGKQAGDISRTFDAVFNCTGPLDTLVNSPSPLLQQLLTSRHIEPDALRMGIAVDDLSEAKNSPNLWAIGSLTKGTFWEITAIPEIALQIADIARAIASRLEERKDVLFARQPSTGTEQPAI